MPKRAGIVARLHGDEAGSILVETALGVIAVLMVALPFAGLIQYAAVASSDLSSVQSAARESARTGQLVPTTGIEYRCGSSASDPAPNTCPQTVSRGQYLFVNKSQTVSLPFGLSLQTDAHAVSYVEKR